MSDTSNPANLASADDFDARLKRTDEDRWLATRYAPRPAREQLVAIYLLHQELRRTLQTREAMLGKIRLQWWRETIEQIAAKAPLRRHDLAEELSRVMAGRADLIAPVNALIDSFDDILDDHLHGGHTDGVDHEARHLATEGALNRLAARALDPTISQENLTAVARVGEAHLAVTADLPDAVSRWAEARTGLHDVPSAVWPAILHLAIVASPPQVLSPFAKRWRLFKAALTRRL